MVETDSTLMTLDEFMQRYSDEGPFEVVEGEIIPVTPQNTLSGMVAGELYLALATYVKSKQLGQVFIEVPFVLQLDAKWVTGARVPDIMFVCADRIAQLEAADPDWKTKPLTLVPDLAIEVISPTDRLTDV
ncbi:MAG: Uma2 family endonuclease, partial [Anaerolineae bacterium]|nr:Uma2 family endonuclease [Anaerolineae bacterium]